MLMKWAEPKHCTRCDRWFRKASPHVGCTLWHSFGTCCHCHDTEVPAPRRVSVLRVLARRVKLFYPLVWLGSSMAFLTIGLLLHWGMCAMAVFASAYVGVAVTFITWTVRSVLGPDITEWWQGVHEEARNG